MGGRGRTAFALGAIVLAFAAAVMPTGWYSAIPLPPQMPAPPVSGVTLLRGLMLLEAVALMLASVFQWHVPRLSAEQRYGGSANWNSTNDCGPRTAGWCLGVITLLALALRLFHANADLWLDEISPIMDYGSMPVFQVIGSYLRSNNHLLNTLLLKLSIAIFGEHEWSVRLAAILFGVASIPVLYWCARLALSREASLGAALLLTVSYHHVFFSQNARGYSAYIFFALLGTRLLADALREDRFWIWSAYVITVVLGFASLLNTAFVLAAHGLICLGALWVVHRRGDAAGPLAFRLTIVFVIAAVLSLQLYIVALPEVYVVITHVYTSQSTGFVLFSLDFVREVVRGVAAGFGPGILVAAVPFLLVAFAGFVALVRRRWVLALALALPGALTATFLVVRGLTFSPRFFLLWLPLTMITAVLTVQLGVAWIFRHRTAPSRMIMATVILVLATLSAASLPGYYAVPKQPFRQALSTTERLAGPNDRIFVIYTAEKGIRYYGARLAQPIDQRYRFVRSVGALDSELAMRGTGRILLIVTFERALRMELPELYARMSSGWAVRSRFAGTVGDGGITIWDEKVAVH